MPAADSLTLARSRPRPAKLPHSPFNNLFLHPSRSRLHFRLWKNNTISITVPVKKIKKKETPEINNNAPWFESWQFYGVFLIIFFSYQFEGINSWRSSHGRNYLAEIVFFFLDWVPKSEGVSLTKRAISTGLINFSLFFSCHYSLDVYN